MNDKELADMLGESALEFAEHYKPKCDCPEHESCEECDRFQRILYSLSTIQRALVERYNPTPIAKINVK